MAKVSILAQKDKKIFKVECDIDFEHWKQARDKAPFITVDCIKSGEKFTKSSRSQLSEYLGYVINAYECYLSAFNTAQWIAKDRANRKVEIEGYARLKEVWDASRPNNSEPNIYITKMLNEYCKQNKEVSVPKEIILNKGDCAIEVRDLFSYSPENEEKLFYDKNKSEKKAELQAIYDGIKNAIKIYSIEETTEYDELFPGVREPEKYICDLPDLKPFTGIMEAQEIVIGQEIKNLLKEEPVLSIDSAKFNQL